MLLTKEQADARLSSSSNLANRFSRTKAYNPPAVSELPKEETPAEEEVGEQLEAQEVPQDRVTIVDKPKPGKRPELTQATKTAIAILSNGTQTQTEIAEMFGTTQGEVSHIRTGRVSGGDQKKVEEALGKVRDFALDKLMESMGLITKDKLEACSAVMLSNVAANMGRVLDKTLPKDQNAGAQLQLVIHAPQLRQENNFHVVEVD